MDRINYQELASEIVAKAVKLGANQAQVSISSSRHFSTEVRDGTIEKLEEAGNKSMSLKIIVDSKVATATSSDFSNSIIENLIKNTITRASFSGRDELAQLPEGEKALDTDLKIYDANYDSIKTEDKITFAKTLERIAKQDKRIKLSNGSYFSSLSGETTIANSKGFASSYIYSRYYTGVTLQSGEDNNMYQDGAYEAAINFAELPEIDSIAKKAIGRVSQMIGARKINTQKVPIVTDARMTASLLGFLAECLNGRNIYMNRSFLSGKLGKKVAGSNINIIDDGTMPGMIGSAPFDSEGVASKRKYLIKDGVLENYLLDTYAARKLKLKSTGNASGSSNLFLESGDYSRDELIKSLGKGLLLINTIGQGTMANTGDISKGAYGLWIENGEIAYPVTEITISSNLGTILNSIEMIANNPEQRQSTFGPSIKISEMTISGK